MRICFVTTELAPHTPGGAGVVVSQLRRLLMEAGNEVSVVLMTEATIDPSEGVFITHDPGSFRARAQAAADAVAQLAGDESFDLIEFQDFDGIAFEALILRSEFGLDRTPIQVRFHGPSDLMFEAIGTEPPEIEIARSMESSSYRMADRVVVPSEGIRDLVIDRYSLDAERVAVGAPPVPVLPHLDAAPAEGITFVTLGRLGEVKGSHDLAAAAAPVLRDHPSARVVMIGEDGWSATAHVPMSQWLYDEVVPPDVAERFVWKGRLVGADLAATLSGAWALVVPSRFESFNLAAHQARRAGLPVVVPDLPAFEPFDEQTGALVYEPGPDGLRAALERLVSDASLRTRLADAPPPETGDPLIPYRDAPIVRHPRSQAGLGTAAIQHLNPLLPPPEEPWDPETADRSRLRRAGSSTLLALPQPVSERAVALIPGGLRAKLGFVADWQTITNRRRAEVDAETQRRIEELRERSLDMRIASGAYPELDEPLVTVVVPCHDDGEYLDDAIRSVLRQTLESFEIIIVDDGSTEPRTVEILCEPRWPRTRVIRQENRGLAAARNRGMSEARGQYLVPLDADDEIEPRFIETLVAALHERPDAAFAACRARLFGDINSVWVPRPYNAYQLLLSNSLVGCVLMRADAWRGVGGYDETMVHGNEDWELWLRFLEAGFGVVEVPDVLFRYRKRGVSMSVLTEARFEEGRSSVVARHPDLYAAATLTERKLLHYPLVSFIVTEEDVDSAADQNVPDAEILRLTSGGSGVEPNRGGRWPTRDVATMEEAVRTARGKYLVDWRGADAEPSTAITLAKALEDDPDAGAASTDGEAPITLVRRWSVLDPDGPADEITAEATGRADHRLRVGQVPDPAWMVPAEIDGLPVQRQRPEEEGFVPEWVPA